jgi:hypothetical protein
MCNHILLVANLLFVRRRHLYGLSLCRRYGVSGRWQEDGVSAPVLQKEPSQPSLPMWSRLFLLCTMPSVTAISRLGLFRHLVLCKMHCFLAALFIGAILASGASYCRLPRDAKLPPINFAVLNHTESCPGSQNGRIGLFS